MTPEAAVAELRAAGNAERAAGAAAYHKAPRDYLGVKVPEIDDMARRWREGMDVPARVALASALWDTNIHEARIAAAKLLTQARIKDDEPVWRLVVSWVPDFDAWAIADHASIAGQKRLRADPARLDTVETWVASPHMWTRRAALVMTLPWTKQNHPKLAEEAARDRILGWCATLADDRDWFIQKAVAS